MNISDQHPFSQHRKTEVDLDKWIEGRPAVLPAFLFIPMQLSAVAGLTMFN
jgi:hypothetical protein